MKRNVKNSTNEISHCYYQYIDLYGVHIVLYYGSKDKCIKTTSRFLSKRNKTARKEIIDYLKKYIGSPEDTSDYFAADLRIDNIQWIFICIGTEYDLMDTRQIAYLSHECLHAAIFIAREHGFYEDEGNSEALVYLQDFILEKFLSKIKKTKDKVENNDNNKSNNSK